MKTLFLTLLIFLSFACVEGQEMEFEIEKPAVNEAGIPRKPFLRNATEEIEIGEANFQSIHDGKTETTSTPTDLKTEQSSEETSKKTADIKNALSDDDTSPEKNKDKFHWKPALIQSGIFLGIQHGARLTQEKTTRQLGGPFFRDWGRSVKNLRGWRDGDNFFTNYIAHPLQGAATGRIFINNSDNAKKQEFGSSKSYWQSRFKTMIWSAAWSTQFELGPVSEASLGNVGQYNNSRGQSRMAWGDLITTPIAGTGAVIGEDIIDKYVLKGWIERKAGKATTRIKIFRSLLTPTTSFTNLLRGKAPWKRDNRFN